MNKGGTVEVAGVKVTMVHAEHSCGILDEGKVIYGGEAAGYVMEFENGYRVYHAGDTNIFSGMELIARLYRPDLAILPIGGHYTMGPKEAAMACGLLSVRTVIPMHYGTFPVLTGTPADLEREATGLEGLRVVGLKPGESF
jgi:L-ascorbate metabolism protein UlaG (beta-lactamase superfamily)